MFILTSSMAYTYVLELPCLELIQRKSPHCRAFSQLLIRSPLLLLLSNVVSPHLLKPSSQVKSWRTQIIFAALLCT